MDLATDRDSGSGGGCWVEVRPLVTSELLAANFVPVLDALHSLGVPFRFFIAAPRDGGGGGSNRSLVRFFLHIFDEQNRVQISNIIRTVLDVEVVGGAEPLTQQYRFCADLELAKHYALPVVFNCSQQETGVNLVDRLVASAAGLDMCVEVTARADPNAAAGIQKFVYDKLSHKSGAGTLFLDPLVDLMGAGIGKNPQPEGSTVRSGQARQKIDAWSRELVKQAELKLSNNLFTCQIHIWGNSLQNVQAVKKALPAAATNKFKTYKTTKKPKHPPTTLKTPTRYMLRNNILCRLWWTIPLSILLYAGIIGLFNPLKLIFSSTSPTVSFVDGGFVVLTASLAICLFIIFRRRQPIVLSTQELAQIVGLPTAIEKLPIALGKVPLSRMQLGSKPPPTEKDQKQTTEEEKEDKPASVETKKEKKTTEEQTQETNSLSIPPYRLEGAVSAEETNL
jgi:hypothetical protein